MYSAGTLAREKMNCVPSRLRRTSKPYSESFRNTAPSPRGPLIAGLLDLQDRTPLQSNALAGGATRVSRTTRARRGTTSSFNPNRVDEAQLHMTIRTAERTATLREKAQLMSASEME